MKRYALCASLIALALAGNILAAAETPNAETPNAELPNAETLTLVEARQLALAASSSLASLDLSKDSAVIDERLQLYESLPSVALSASSSITAPGTATVSVSDSAQLSLSASATQTVFSGGKNTVLASIDKLSSSITRENARAGYFSVLDSIDAAWYALQEAYATKESAEASISAYGISLEIAKARLDIGAVSVTDYLEAESNAEAARATAGQANRDVMIYSRKVASLTGLDRLPSIERADFSRYEPLVSLFSALSDADADALVEKIREAALANNPDLAAARLAREKAGKQVRLSACAYLPTVTAGASTGLSYTALDGLSDPEVKVSVAGSLSLDAWVTKASVDKAKIAERQSDAALSEAGRKLDIDLATAIYGCVAEARSIVSSAKALEYAEKHYENKLELYELASASVNDLSDAASLVSANRGALIKARYALLASLSTVRSLGAFDSDDAVLAAMTRE